MAVVWGGQPVACFSGVVDGDGVVGTQKGEQLLYSDPNDLYVRGDANRHCQHSLHKHPRPEIFSSRDRRVIDRFVVGFGLLVREGSMFQQEARSCLRKA